MYTTVITKTCSEVSHLELIILLCYMCNALLNFTSTTSVVIASPNTVIPRGMNTQLFMIVLLEMCAQT